MEGQRITQLLSVHNEFLGEWFGIHGGREVFYADRKAREFIEQPWQLEDYVTVCRTLNLPAYCSVQPYSSRDQVFGLEKLFWDFDCEADTSKAWTEAKFFAEILVRYYNVKPLLVFSGRKGYHLYVFLEQTVQFPTFRSEFVKKVLTELQTRLMKGLKFSALDPAVVGDLKRLARVPYSTHEKSGLLCQPVTLDKKPIPIENLNLEPFRREGLSRDLLEAVVKAVANRENEAKKPRFHVKKHFNRDMRPCIEYALTVPLEHGEGHKMRLAIASEYLNHGYSIPQVVDLFRSQVDFNEAKTRYFVEDAQRKGYKPFKCRTIRELGFCLPSCQRRRKT